MLVSAAQQHEWVTSIHTSFPLEPPSHPHIPSPQVITEPPSWAGRPMLHRSFPLAIYLTRDSVYMSVPRSPFVPPPLPPILRPHVCSLGLHRYSCPENRFICTISLGYICVLICHICFSLSDLLHSEWQTLWESTSLQMTQFHFSLWLSNIPSYICMYHVFFTHSSVDVYLNNMATFPFWKTTLFYISVCRPWGM